MSSGEVYIDVLRSGDDPESEVDTTRNDALHADLLASTASTTGFSPNGRSERTPLVTGNGNAGSGASNNGTGKAYIALETLRRGLSSLSPSDKSKGM